MDLFFVSQKFEGSKQSKQEKRRRLTTVRKKEEKEESEKVRKRSLAVRPHSHRGWLSFVDHSLQRNPNGSTVNDAKEITQTGM